MLRMVFAVVYILLVILLVWLSMIARKKSSKMTLPVIKVIMAAAMTSFFYALYLFVSGDGRQPAGFIMGLYYLSVSWLVFFLTDYTMIYTEVKLVTKSPRVVLMVLVVIDSVSILINNFTGHVFTMKQVMDKSGGAYYWTSQPGWVMNIHLILCYLMILLTFIALVYKTAVSPKIYRKKYASILILLAVVILVNAGFLFVGLEIDFSVLIYSVLGPLVCYFTLYSTPKKLADRTHSYVIEEMGNAIICFDIDGTCVYVNQAAKKLFSVWSGQNDMDRIEELYSGWRNTDGADVKERDYWDGELMIDGTKHYFGFEYRDLTDEEGTYIGCFFRIEDKTEDVIRFREEQYRATHDHLTGLYNRESFFEECRNFIGKHAGETMYMLASNIKDFKLVNELFGNDKGDEILKKEAGLLMDRGAQESVAGRIAGDKFAQVILKQDFDKDYLIDNIEQLCSLANESMYKMHLYVGVYEIADTGEPVQTMYDKANMAIEHIKGDYHRIISFYDENDMKALMHEKSIVAEFDRAIDNREFCLYLQPQVDCTGRALGAEALVRWMHPKQGILYPDSFIGILEKAGLIYKLDNYIWEASAQRLKMWKDAGLEQYHISVNISAKDFYYLDLYEVFTGLVKKYDINPARLNLEITETVIMSDVKMHMEVVEKLQKFGFHIEIDDFGSGYSSLNTLKDIKADVLKIDMLFLRDTQNQARSKAILNSVISMAKTLNMPVITEGVETKNQVDFLSVMGCDIFQGYYFSKPVSVKEFEEKYFKTA